MAKPMTITEAFARHTTQEFPPKFVFYLEIVAGVSNILTVMTEDIPALEKTHSYWGDISEIREYLDIFDKTGHLPVLTLNEV